MIIKTIYLSPNFSIVSVHDYVSVFIDPKGNIILITLFNSSMSCFTYFVQLFYVLFPVLLTSFSFSMSCFLFVRSEE